MSGGGIAEALEVRSQVVRIAELPEVRKASRIAERLFVDCEVYGPAVLVAVGRVHFTGSTFMLGDATVEAMFIEVADDRGPVVGCIGLEGVVFEDCRIHNCAFIGAKAALEGLRETLT